MLTIQCNGSKWAGESPDSLDDLLARLDVNILDPRFEAYGNFILPDDKRPGVVRFWGNFYDLSAVFSVDTDDPATIDRLTRAIRANQATSRYAAAQEERARSDRAREEYLRRKDEERRKEALDRLEALKRQVLG